MCDKVVYNFPSAMQFIPECYKTLEICSKAVFEDLFMLKYCLDRNNTQEMCDKAADDFQPKLKFVPDWFVTNKMIKKLQAMKWVFLLQILIIP